MTHSSPTGPGLPDGQDLDPDEDVLGFDEVDDDLEDLEHVDLDALLTELQALEARASVRLAARPRAAPPVPPPGPPPALPTPSGARAPEPPPRAWSGTALLLVAVTCVNLVVAGLAFRRAGRAPAAGGPPAASVQHPERNADKGTWPGTAADPPRAVADPLVPPGGDETFLYEQVKRDLENGAFERARERLYAFLAAVDRLEPGQRSAAEARASLWLSRAYHLEACRVAEGRP